MASVYIEEKKAYLEKSKAAAAKSAAKRKLDKKMATVAMVGSKVDMVEERKIVIAVVEQLYINGTNLRAVKKGKSGKQSLIEKIVKPRNIATIGVFGRLTPDDQKIVDDKKLFAVHSNDPEFLKRVAKTILDADRFRSPGKLGLKIYVRLTEIGAEVLKELAVTGVLSPKNNWFKIRTIFEDQERQKVLGK